MDRLSLALLTFDVGVPAATPDAFACFLEDDVHFSADFPAFLREDSWIPADADAVTVGVNADVPVVLGTLDSVDDAVDVLAAHIDAH